MSWGNPMALWFLVFIPAIILLYFLKLKRREVTVSSTLLWARVLEDRRVNSPFQRFRRNLLLLLQILAVALLVGALTQPERLTENVPGRTHIILVDVSASMSVREGGETRLDGVKGLVRDYVEGMGPDERGVVIRFSRRAEALTPVTADRSLLKKAVNGLTIRPSQTLIDDAMELAVSIAKTQEDAIGVVFSDGVFPPWEAGEIPLPVDYVKVGERNDNSGIVALSSRMDFRESTTLQVYVEVKNYAGTAASGYLTISRDGNEIRAAQSESIAPGGKWSHSFAAEFTGGLVEVAWDPAGDDALVLDNRAWLEVEARRKVLVWRIGDDNYFLDEGLAALPDLEVRLVEAAGLEERLASVEVAPDIIIWDRVEPETLPAGVKHLLFGVLPPGLWEDATIREVPPVVSWDKAHPVNRYLNYSALDQAIEKAYVLEKLPNSTLLLETSEGGLIATFTAPGTRGIVVGFDTLRSSWPVNLSWPFFLFNSISYLAANEASSGIGARSEELLSLRFPTTVKECDLLRPDGRLEKLAPDPTGWVRYPHTDVLGSYLFSWAEPDPDSDDLLPRQHHIPVNLLSATESNIEPRDALEISGTVVSSSAARGVYRREFWPWILAVALAFLLIEWYFYHRR